VSEDQFQLAVIVGSVRDGRFGPVVANWFVRQAERRDDVKIDVIDLAENSAHGVDFASRIGAADAFVVVTPEYNHSYPGPLKTAIDSVVEEWRAKPVGFVSYGGISGGLRAIEALRIVFGELHAVTVRETVSFHLARRQFDDKGETDSPKATIAADRLLDQLSWWAYALRRAKAHQPYVG
jgi:NAD(P)H-dependent FMN reductase